MWITRYMNESSGDRKAASLGSVTSNVGTGVEVNASASFRNLPLVTPFGVEYVPPLGESALVTEAESRRVCMGVLKSAPKNLLPGELRICSQGGASLTLKNDGRILLEGRLYINDREVTF
ncbi:MAG: hypothetical protein ACI4HJ_02705 [Ruminococcus sp.]